jgi:hypothetical protein
MTNSMLHQCLIEAEQRKTDSTLPIDVRVRSFETYELLLRVAESRGLVYPSKQKEWKQQ